MEHRNPVAAGVVPMETRPVSRRRTIQALAATVLGGVVSPRQLRAEAQAERAARGMPSPRIKDVQVICTAPQAARLTIVKVITDQDGLYGYGCSGFTTRSDLIVPAVEKYLKPFLLGRPADRIDDIWQASYNSSYWRNGPVLNNAISGVDQALWDIKGRQTGLPVYQLLGGKCREAVTCYSHASGAGIPEVIESARRIMAAGFRHVRVQVGIPGYDAYGSAAGGQARVKALHDAPVFEPGPYMRRTLEMMEACRKQLGDEVELLHDVHEHLPPRDTVLFAKEMERFRLFFLEDSLPPEQIAYFRQIREQCATPIAMGELFNSPHEWTPLITERLIDYIRIHVSEAGGLTPCRKIAAMAELFGVKTAWHGPADVSPIGHAANVALDLACYNFGIQEYAPFNEQARDVFRGTLVARQGYLYANESPGWGIEVDEKAAAKFPFPPAMQRNDIYSGWVETRRLDGTVITW
jgi:mannonate dehydratase